MNTVTEFIDQLKLWGKRETGDQRAAMAELRRGLQEFPQLAPYMHRYIAPFTTYKKGWDKQSYYLTAALFARYHSGSAEPVYSDKSYVNMGTYFHAVVQQEQEVSEATERRFNALLTAHPQDLHYHLRQAIAFLHSKSEANIAINWETMFWDILQWDDDDKRPGIQERWAENFWRRPSSNNQTTDKQAESNK
ncbi:MAG: type I-E CRISPR-associated protein Cse2/CasB [Caldilineaceae bacterium]|nr:type I-E CRISPR-associated protein Cse2/CasB [Caldilineaceae bacterium]